LVEGTTIADLDAQMSQGFKQSVSIRVAVVAPSLIAESTRDLCDAVRSQSD
jgi:hypothetical protein